jgi:hypothetical protein
MPRNQHHTARLESGRRGKYMAKQGFSCQLVQYFGRFTLHARALARRHDHNV